MTSQTAATTPRTWNTSGHGSRVGTSGARDDARGHEAVDHLGCEAELFQDLVGVLADQRCGATDRGGRRRRARRKAEHARAPETRLLELRDEAGVPHPRIV